MKVAIIGYGIEGNMSANYWHSLGNDITVCDQNPDKTVPDQYTKKLGDEYLKDLHEFDIIVRTAGLRPQIIIDANSNHPEVIDKITTSLNEFLRVCPSKNVIGITGTKGKGTTSTLLLEILQAAKKSAIIGGNIGIAALELLPKIKPDDYVILELSSFQLIDLKVRIPTAACLMIAPEHLNWHAHLEEYYEAKAQLFKLQEPGDTAIYNKNSALSVQIASSSPGHKLAYDVPPAGAEPSTHEAAYVLEDKIYYQDTEIMPVGEVNLPGRHNLDNICAAITLAWPFIDGNLEAIRSVARTFSGLPHHTEYVTTIDDVIYYNDSYSTMPDATVAALEAIPGKKVLILGGGSKNLPLEHMMDAVAKADLRWVILMGSLAKDLEKMLLERNIKNYSFSQNGMKDIVAEAKKHAEKGDIVLLSPGLPAKGDGFFIDNVDRGNQYKECLGVESSDRH